MQVSIALYYYGKRDCLFYLYPSSFNWWTARSLVNCHYYTQRCPARPSQSTPWRATNDRDLLNKQSPSSVWFCTWKSLFFWVQRLQPRVYSLYVWHLCYGAETKAAFLGHVAEWWTFRQALVLLVSVVYLSMEEWMLRTDSGSSKLPSLKDVAGNIWLFVQLSLQLNHNGAHLVEGLGRKASLKPCEP